MSTASNSVMELTQHQESVPPIDIALRRAEERKVGEPQRMRWDLERPSRGDGSDGGPFAFEQIIGHSPALRTVLEQVQRVAATGSTVLIQGETGTGKEIIAHAIYSVSPRSGCPYIKLNCAAIPFDLLESELFGYERGAFTGAFAQKIGRFELADKGTLFLDEVGDIPLALQPKLLRVLQEQEFERLGSGRPHKVDVRLVAATHWDLGQMVKQNQFRSDLFYRLNVFPITLPPLRERPEDIEPLVKHYVDVCARKMGKTIDCIPEEIISEFKSYSWPGNIRELQNLIERAVILSSDGLLPNPLLVKANEPIVRRFPGSDYTTLRDSEYALIVQTLESVGWVIGGSTGAAARLGVKRTTLLHKMKKLGISRPSRAVNASASLAGPSYLKRQEAPPGTTMPSRIFN